MQKKHWLLFGIVVLGAAVFSYKYFDQAIPFVKVHITMDNHQARQEAIDLAGKYDWGVADFDTAVQYQEDGTLQAFVELEGGGKQAFIDMIEKNYHQPYQWHVRFYKEQEIKEVNVTFTPSGQPYDFSIKLPENFDSVALSKDAALQVALNGIQAWHVDLQNYELVEHHREEMLAGRVDHLFIYQRSDISLNNGLYRIKLKVSGDLFSALQHTVKIPDEFIRRYEQMYSTNKMLAGIARNTAFLLYLFIFALFAFVFFFNRKGGLLVVQNIKLMVFFAILMVLHSMNQWPLIWNNYPTQVTHMTFIFQQIFSIALNVFIFTLLVAFIVLTAEAAGRYVYGKHIQFFRLWSAGVVGSYQILEQTLLGYGCAVIMMGYAVGFALIAQKLGWWSPLSTIIDPNILSTPVPCVSPIVDAFKAGFWEEFMCRALPLAGVLLLARNSSNKWRWFGLMFVVQIFIFGTWHASYPQQPAYYRIVELFVGSIGFGSLYWAFGLLPGIICHFIFDAFLMSMPIFVSNLFFQKVAVVLIMLIPLLIVLGAWLWQGKKFKNVPSDAYNQAFKFGDDDQKQGLIKRLVGQPVSRNMQMAAIFFGIVGLLLTASSKELEIDTAPITMTVKQVQDLACKIIEMNFGPLGSQWTMTKEYISPRNSVGGKYIWQTFGKQGYDQLQGSYILQPSYAIKFVKFNGSVEDRSEFFEVVLQTDGTVSKLHHAIPEFWQGADISQDEAKAIALEWIVKLYGISDQDLSLVSSQSVKHAQRRDWTIIFKDIKNYSFASGQARILVQIAGDKLSLIVRFVYAPESWIRSEESRNTQEKLLQMVLLLIAGFWCLLFLVSTVYRFGISVRYFAPFVLLTSGFVLIKFAAIATEWYTMLYHFSTAEPISHQIIHMIGFGIISYLTAGAGLALLLMSSFYFGVRAFRKNWMSALPLGIALGSGLFGIISIFKYFEPSFAPNTAYSGFSLCILPTLAIMISHFMLPLIPTVVTLMALFASIEIIAERFKQYVWLKPVLFMLAGIVISHSAQLSNVSVWIVSGLVFGLAWYWIYRYFLVYDSDLIWIIVATIQILQLLPTALNLAYPGVVMQVFGSCLLILGLLIMLYRKI